jgi:lysophospholipase L1-like esterase
MCACSGVTEEDRGTKDEGTKDDGIGGEPDVGPGEDGGARDDGTADDAGGDGGTDLPDASNDASDLPDSSDMSDAGVSDVGPADAGAVDSGSGDDAGAGEDSGPKDASVQDTGPADAGTPDAGAVDTGAADAGAADAGGGSFPIDDLDQLSLYVNLGDSMGAGYNATGRNGTGGKGYARLVLENHKDYPAYATHHLKALFGAVQFKDNAESGDTSSDQLSALKSSIAFFPSATGDVLVSLTCGGNDFNNDIQVMLFRAQTEAAASKLQDNYREIAKLIKNKYENIPAGKRVVFLVTNVTDPTGGTGNVPAQYNDGFCKTIHNPLFTPQLRADAIANLEFFNDKIAEVTAEIGGYMVDSHAMFFDHGMNASGSDRWLDTDCVHPTNEGHHQLRREEWATLTGERF